MVGDLASLAGTPEQILRSRDAKGREKQYVAAMEKDMEEHCVLQRLVKISSVNEPDEQKMEAIDQDITRAMAHVMSKIRRIYTSPFSPQIKQARLRRRFYKLHLSMLLNNLDLRHKLESLTQALHEVLPAPSNIKEVKQLLLDPQKNVREITKKAAELCISYLEEQTQNLIGVDDKKAALIRKRIVQAEETKTMYMKLR
jgi:hypothetical protein